MKITESIHALEIPFKVPVAPEIQVDRLVFAYLIFGKKITLIDSGVAGADTAPFGRGRASLVPLVGQNNDHKKSKTGKRTVINQNKNQEEREKSCRHFPQVVGAAHLAPVRSIGKKGI